ncbi:MAG: MBL fold metallo-hydrolase [Desulfurella sp.]|uniref:MBL fold metallo-hydrolase n=1 Tax=Desulfurella sp. TaxID=1962857 RepID=UPI003D0B0A2A
MGLTKWHSILSGLPITSNRGFVGWSSVSLIKFDNHLGLFDTGTEGSREIIIKSLQTMNISTMDIEFVILSHLHFDHFINVELFPRAKIYTTEQELNYALSKEPEEHNDFNYVKSSINFFKNSFIIVDYETQIYGGKIIHLPGHTKGSLGFETEDCIFAGDALKYFIEAKTGQTTYAYYNKELADNSIKKILLKNKIIVPGHDPAFKFENNSIISLYDASVEIYKRRDSFVNITIKDI